jgi:membrane protein YdbS with pleckstrin-like domain
MKCPVCNAEAPAGALFCQHCGAKLGSSEKGAGQVSPASAPVSAQARAADPAAIKPGPALAGRRRQDVPEEILWEDGYSPKAMLVSAVLCGVVSLLVIVGTVWQIIRQNPFWFWGLILLVLIWSALLARLAAKRLGIHYKLTNQMFYHQRGILTRTTDRIEVIDIDDITYTQGLFERLVNVGRIEVLSSDRTNPKFCVEGVENVEEVAKTMDRARRAERIRRGVSVDSLAPGASSN